MANRTTVKNNIQVINVPTVSNADMNTMLQTNICDNVVFKEDVAVSQSSSVTAITCDFTGKDRINLTRTGGALQITLAGIADGDRVFLLITKTAGQAVTFVGATDITSVKYYANALSTVLYEIVRKGSNYFAFAWVETVKIATSTVEGVKKLTTVTTVLDDTNADMVITSTLKSRHATTGINGLVKKASQTQFNNGEDSDPGNNSIYPLPSQIKAQLNGVKTKYVEIGDWDMSSNFSKSVSHGVTFSKIIGVEAIIKNDADTAKYPFPLQNPSASNGDQMRVEGTQVIFQIYAGSLFDNANFDSLSYNRGYIVIKYIN